MDWISWWQVSMGVVILVSLAVIYIKSRRNKKKVDEQQANNDLVKTYQD